MQQPDHLKALQATQQANSRRFFSFGFVVLFHVFVIYAFASGLANHLVEKIPVDIIAKVEQPKLPDVKPPPPPPPDLAKPPPPFVPPPDIVIQQEAANPNTITVQHTQQVAPPPPKAQGITAPASIGKAHECANYYPPIAQRLNQEGEVTVQFHISADGSVSDPSVVQSSGHDLLDQAALRCVPSWRYKPAMANGAAVETTWKAVVKFKMNGG